jgi:hypothetical protein
VDLGIELQRIYENEVNARIGWLWDGGIEVRLGDEVNGFLAEETVEFVADIVPWLQETIAHFYPTSSYAASIDSEIRERGAKRLFQRPKSGFSVICPECGASHAAPPGMDELIRFICVRCGNGVTVEPPKIQ